MAEQDIRGKINELRELLPQYNGMSADNRESQKGQDIRSRILALNQGILEQETSIALYRSSAPSKYN